MRTSDPRLKSLEGKHAGQDCLLLCNGPSLNRVDFSRIDRNRLSIFGTNKIFLGLERFGITLDYYAAVNHQVLEQAAREIAELDAVKFLSGRANHTLLPNTGDIHYINTTHLPRAAQRFSHDVTRYVHEGWTVTHVALQLISYLGFERVFIVGMDHRFGQAVAGEANVSATLSGPDSDHFDPRYFGYGQTWDQPDIDKSEASYRSALEAYTSLGKTILDCTIDGACDVFPKAAIDDVLYTGSQESEPRPLSNRADKTADVDECLFGPFGRASGYSVDESYAVYRWCRGRKIRGLMVDVGAHHGSAMRPFLDDGWDIIAFEPDDSNRSVLEDYLSHQDASSIDRVTLDKRGVSDVSKQGIPFFVSDVSSGISGLSSFHSSHRQAQNIDVVSLSDYFSEQEDLDVAFLKIDTEGFDKFVLDGYPWEKGKPLVVECEFEDAKTVPLGYSFADLAGQLEDRGYSVYVSEWHPVVEYGRSHQWRELKKWPCALGDPGAWGNLIAIRDDIDDSAFTSSFSSSMRNGKDELSAMAMVGTAPRRGDAMTRVPGLSGVSLWARLKRAGSNWSYYRTNPGLLVLCSILCLLGPICVALYAAFGWGTEFLVSALLGSVGLFGLLTWIPHSRNSLQANIESLYGNMLKSLRAELRAQQVEIEDLKQKLEESASSADRSISSDAGDE